MAEEKMKRKQGRPRKEGDHFDKQFLFRGNSEHEYMRHALEEELGKNGGEIMREALEIFYNMKIGWKQ